MIEFVALGNAVATCVIAAETLVRDHIASYVEIKTDALEAEKTKGEDQAT